MLTVHLRVNDEATGRPVPVWLRVTDADGRYRPPLGRLAAFSVAPGRDVGGQALLDGQAFACINGTCEVPLPPGVVHVEVERGPEYSPLSRLVTLAAGQMSLRLAVGRWADWSADGWTAGDTRSHELTPAAAALEGAAAGLSVVQLLARERPPVDGEAGGISGLLDFSGDRSALEAHGCSVAVNTLNSHPVLGTVSLLNCHRPVYPLRSGGPDGFDDWSVADWCDQCHRKAGLVVWPDLPRLSSEFPQGEALAALILGKIDAFEIGPVESPHAPAVADYYRLLDCGLRPVLVGGSGKDSNAAVLGSMRTYARTDPTTPWLAAVRAGRTFVTTSPLLSLTVAGQTPGTALSVTAGQRVRLRAEAHSAVPFDYLELIVNGEVQATKTASGNRTSAVLETDYVCRTSSWVAGTCHSQAKVRGGACVFAHTSAVHLDIPGAPPRPSPQTAAGLLDILTQTRAWAVDQMRPSAEKQRQHLLAVLDEAADRLRQSVEG